MDDQLLDVNTLAQYLSFTRSTVYRLIKRGVIPAFRIGPYIRVSRSEVERLLHENVIAQAAPDPPPRPAPLPSRPRPPGGSTRRTKKD